MNGEAPRKTPAGEEEPAVHFILPDGESFHYFLSMSNNSDVQASTEVSAPRVGSTEKALERILWLESTARHVRLKLSGHLSEKAGPPVEKLRLRSSIDVR